MKLLEALNERYATKRMTGEKLDDSLVAQIIEAARLAPTSAGLQPFNIIVISNPALKAKISPIALSQPQIVESSHLLVFASWDEMDNERMEEMYQYIYSQRSLPFDRNMDVMQNLRNLFATFTKEQQHHHSAKQAHIGFGMAIAAAAELGVDATPMEGFDKEALDVLLHLRALGLKSVTLLALGRRDEKNDWLYGLKKVRLPMDRFAISLG
ncbi:nitroreductase family protein [Stenotrophomonas terrae]|uniref:nitroreductase family protein n=1 Tax=Stenotrophomonas terrae TaxID=405446 RepID=UPI00320B58CE